MTYDDFDATELLLDATTLLGEAEKLRVDVLRQRDVLENPGQSTASLNMGVERIARVRLAAAPAVKERLVRSVTALRERCESSLLQKRVNRDSMDDEFARQEPEAVILGAFYSTATDLIWEEIERTQRAIVQLDEIDWVLACVSL